MERPDIRPQLRELLAWYEDRIRDIQAGAVVVSGTGERLREEQLRQEAIDVASLIALLDEDDAPSAG